MYHYADLDIVVDSVELGSGSCGYRGKDASREHLRVLLGALVAGVNIHLDLCGEFFNREMSIFAEHVVGLGAHHDFSDISAAGSPSGLVASLGETRCGLEDFSSSVMKLIERKCRCSKPVPLCSHNTAVVNDISGVYLSSILSVYGLWFWHCSCDVYGRDECIQLGLINGSCSVLDMGDCCQQCSHVIE